jgi:perosamine synthetase
MARLLSDAGHLCKRKGETLMIKLDKPSMEAEKKQAELEVLKSGTLTQRPRASAFEEAFAEFCGTPFAIATSSGATALHIALLAHGLKAGDEVITTPFNCTASVDSILSVGAKPVFVDIHPHTFNIDVSKIEGAITPRTKAILPAHLYGLCCEMGSILKIAKMHCLAVIEDSCQSLGAYYKKKKAGSFGIGAFSVHPTNQNTSAESGMVTTNYEIFAERCKIILDQGMQTNCFHEEPGLNFRMTEENAAIGLAQFKEIGPFIHQRLQNAAFYNERLKGVAIPYAPEGCFHVYNQYTIRVPSGRREALRDHLKSKEIETGVDTPAPIHQQSFYVDMFGKKQRFPQAEHAATEVLSIPIHPWLTHAELETVAAEINYFMRN